MTSTKTISLARRLETILIKAVAGAGIISVLTISFYQIISQKKIITEQASNWVQTLSINLQSALLFDDRKTAQEIVQGTSTFPNVKATWVSKSGNENFALYLADKMNAFDPNVIRTSTPDGILSQTLLVSTPVMVSGE